MAPPAPPEYFKLAPVRKFGDFIGTLSCYSVPTTNLKRLNYRMACNLLYYQTNYLFVWLAIFSIFCIFATRTILVGLGSVGLAALCASFYLSGSPRLASIRQNQNLTVMVIGVSACMCMIYFFKAISTLALACLLPIPFCMIHSAVRSRNIKNKVTNKMEELGLSGLDSTYMSYILTLLRIHPKDLDHCP